MIIVYDATDRRSLANVEEVWMPNVREHAEEDAVVMLVGVGADRIDGWMGRQAGR